MNKIEGTIVEAKADHDAREAELAEITGKLHVVRASWRALIESSAAREAEVKRLREELARHLEGEAMKDKVLKWLLNGRVGLSSKAMAAHLCGFPCEGDYPIDPDDFNRCVMFLDAVPEARALLPKMADVNRYWAALVSRWDEIEAAFRDERRGTCLFYSAPKTHRLITEIINKAAKAEKGEAQQ